MAVQATRLPYPNTTTSVPVISQTQQKISVAWMVKYVLSIQPEILDGLGM